MGGRGAVVGRQRRADQLERLDRVPALMHQHAAEMQRVEMIGPGGEDLAIERLGFGATVRAGAASLRGAAYGNVRLRGLRLRLRLGHGLLRCGGRRKATRKHTNHLQRLVGYGSRHKPPR